MPTLRYTRNGDHSFGRGEDATPASRQFDRYDAIGDLAGDKIFRFAGTDGGEREGDEFHVCGLRHSLGESFRFLGEDALFAVDGETPIFQARTGVGANGDVTLRFDTDGDGRADASIFIPGSPPGPARWVGATSS